MLHPDIKYEIICARLAEQQRMLHLERAVQLAPAGTPFFTQLLNRVGDLLITTGTWLKHRVDVHELMPTYSNVS